MPAAPGKEHVAGIDVLVDGAQAGPEVRDLTLEVKVVDSLTLPDMALVRITDPKGENVDSHPLQLGKDIEIKAAATGRQRDRPRSSRARSPPSSPSSRAKGCIISIRALRQGPQAQPPAQDAHVPADVGVGHGQEDRGRGRPFAQGRVDLRRPRVLPAEQRDRLGLLLAARADARLRGRRRRQRRSSSARPTRPRAPPVALTWQDNLISFRPRMTGIQQPTTVNIRAWDPKNKQAVTAARPAPQTSSQPGVQRRKVVERPGRRHDRDRGPRRRQQRRGQRARQGDARPHGRRVLRGRRRRRSASRRSRPARKVQVKGVGSQFSGTYTVTSSTHGYRGTTGYQTTLPDLRPLEPDAARADAPAAGARLVRDLVVGVVTNNNDPEQMGRVRVKYPTR